MAYYAIIRPRHDTFDVCQRLNGLMKAPGAHHRLATIAAAAAVIAIIVAGIWYYYTTDPSTGGLKCTFKLLTGYDCPGCGSQRALHALLHGEFAKAWNFNPMVFFAVPLALYYLIVEAGRKRWPRLHAASIRPLIIVAIFIGIVAYWIIRNL